ncbi:DUF1574 domain-containing protein [Gemmata sp. JC717]|uniref:DUF1574 domain-containing protein n=1 Tax=Gemmata algarum TaxID=2975278 RepID=UPI0021BA6D7A|nr:DUF1574 domain-containing protein [Gemmata algarum]MDY3555874.1 DUF1574 domain-containing protein [Gemmata algarum]
MNVRHLVPPRLFRPGPRPGPGAARPGARRRAAAALGAGVVAFAAVQAALGALSAVTWWAADPVYEDKRERLARVERSAPPGAARVLLLGTSRSGNGFDAGRVSGASERAGAPAVAFNFGVPGAGPVTQLVYLRRLLADGHRPDVLVIEVLPALLSDAPAGPIETRVMTGDRLARDEVELLAGYGFPVDRLRRQWREAAVLPVHAHRFKLVSRVAPDALPWSLQTQGGRTPDPHGWRPTLVDQVGDEERARRTTDAAIEYREAFAHELPAGPAAAALRDVLTLCRRERLSVALVLFPEGTTFRALYAPGAELRLQQFLAGLSAEFGCPVTDARGWAADDQFVDGHHLLRPGADAFTDRFIHDALIPLLKSQAVGGHK